MTRAGQHPGLVIVDEVWEYERYEDPDPEDPDPYTYVHMAPLCQGCLQQATLDRWNRCSSCAAYDSYEFEDGLPYGPTGVVSGDIYVAMDGVQYRILGQMCASMEHTFEPDLDSTEPYPHTLCKICGVRQMAVTAVHVPHP